MKTRVGVRHLFLYLLLLSVMRPLVCYAGSPRILLDGKFQDWETVPSLWTGSQPLVNDGITLREIKAANDDLFLFLNLNTVETFLLQNYNEVRLYLDSDNNPTTGKPINNIGADIYYNFGQRSGKVYVNNDSVSIGFSDLFTVISPTMMSSQHEFSFARDANMNGVDLFGKDSVKFFFADNMSGTGTPVLSYGYTQTSLDPLLPYSIKKQSARYLRVMTNNVEFDGFFEESNMPRFQRLYQAAQPDIIGLEEIYNHSASEVAGRMEEILPSSAGRSWHASNIADNFLVTQYTILNSYSCGSYGNGAFLIDLQPDYNSRALIIVAHPPCCENDQSRQTEIDAIAAFVRDAKEPGGVMTLPEGAPVLIMGDMNLVGDPQQLRTLLSGDIVNEQMFGNDFAPDWDGSDFLDAHPYDTGLPMSFTQGVGSGPGRFAKGRLDFIIYSGTVLDLNNGFILYTPALPPDSSTYYGLRSDDTENATDHFPVVADFAVRLSHSPAAIASLRQNDNNGVPLTLNDIRTVSGIVTIADGFGAAGPAYIQDATAGMAVYGTSLVSQLTSGDSITITSKVGFYSGLTELVFDDVSATVSVHKNTAFPSPRDVTVGEILNQQWDGFEALEGSLLRVSNVRFLETGIFSSNANYYVTDSLDTLAVRIDGDIDLVGTPIPDSKVNVSGVLSQYKSSPPYDSGYQLMPRAAGDIVPDAGPRSVTVTGPVEGQVCATGSKTEITWTSQNVTSVNIYFRSLGESRWDTLAISFDASAGRYLQWQTPQAKDDSGYVRIQDAADPSVFSRSGVFYIQNTTLIMNMALPGNFALVSIYPNPFNPVTRIRFTLPVREHVCIAVYDLIGRQIDTVIDDAINPGDHEITWNASDLGSGMYFIRISAGHRSATRKVLLIK